MRLCSGTVETDATSCPKRNTALYNVRRFRIDLGDTSVGWATDVSNFRNTGLLTTEATVTALVGATDPVAASFTVEGCGDGVGIRNPQLTLTILPEGLVEPASDPVNGDITIGAPLTISIDSDEPLPTLSFSPTDVEIDEGGTISTVLVAEGPNTNDVKMVKLSVEGDAMVSLMQDGEMLEEMDGHVYVDLGGNSSVRLTAMSHSDPDLMDGDMAFKAWKLVEGGDRRRRNRRGLLVQGRCPRLDGGAGASAGWAAPSGPVPDGRRRAAVSSAPGIGSIIPGVGGTVYARGAPVRMCRVPLRFIWCSPGSSSVQQS